jgi:hypothetical protein
LPIDEPERRMSLRRRTIAGLAALLIVASGCSAASAPADSLGLVVLQEGELLGWMGPAKDPRQVVIPGVPEDATGVSASIDGRLLIVSSDGGIHLSGPVTVSDPGPQPVDSADADGPRR